jgi:tetratricopeptide (TPR) repeat protein
MQSRKQSLLATAAGTALGLIIYASAVSAHDERVNPFGGADGQVAVATDGSSHPAHSWLMTDDVATTPLWPGLGSLSYPISTANPQAQLYFDQGLKLAYAFNHGEALRSFRRAQELDPACAMCFWGEALVLGPNINAGMVGEAVAPAVTAVAKAVALAKGASQREQALIAALAARYSDDPSKERPALDAAYADAMVAVLAQFPDDKEIAVLTAEALMDLQPWDYWQPGGAEPKGRAAEIMRILEDVLAKHRDHPAAIHLYIHMVEASDRPERAEPHAERLAGLMPGAGHMVHMPSHSYYRLGRYHDSQATNVAAVSADRAYLGQTRSGGFYRYALYPHNLHFLMVSAQMTGDGATAVATAEQLDGNLSDDVTKAIAWVQPIKAAPYFAHAQFSDAVTILALPAPKGGFAYVTAMWHYARGVAFAKQGNASAALQEMDVIAAIAGSAGIAELAAGGVPAVQVLEIARLVVEARAAQATGDLASAVDSLEQAVALEDSLPYMEPPFWYYPVRQSLGATLLLQGEAERAAAVFRESLERAPDNGWALYGLREAQAALGDKAGADQTDRLLRAAWSGDPALLTLERL